eukprot:1158047-Pelagomonas_calceolata.AAC.5
MGMGARFSNYSGKNGLRTLMGTVTFPAPPKTDTSAWRRLRTHSKRLRKRRCCVHLQPWSEKLTEHATATGVRTHNLYRLS